MLLEAILEGRFMNCQSGLQFVIVLPFADYKSLSDISYTLLGVIWEGNNDTRNAMPNYTCILVVLFSETTAGVPTYAK